MTMSLRARLTLWHLSVVVAVLALGMAATTVALDRLDLQRLDDDLARTFATLAGVMRTEFGEGLTLEESAAEASVEVVAPGRALAVLTPQGVVLESWGEPFDRRVLESLSTADGPVSVQTASGGYRVLARTIAGDAAPAFVGVVGAPLAPLEAQHRELLRPMLIGVVVALLAAGLGGWLIGRRALTPLTDMAAQAADINEHAPRGRLSSPHTDDELGQLTGAFNGLLDRLAAALDQQRQFMADASHELRTPVSIVRTASQVALTKADRPAAEYRESLAIVADQATRLARMVDAMFLLARAEAHGVPLAREFVNLDDVLHECARALRVQATQRGVRLTIAGDQEVAFTGDDGLLRQMVGNLLDNAIRHARADGQVTADLRRTDEHLRLRVTNDGAAIAPSDRQRIFERFVRVGPSDGAGLGLPIARWIAEAHGGSLDLEESVPGETTFVVTLPAPGPRAAAAAG